MLRAGHSRRPADRAFASCCPELRAQSPGHGQSSPRGTRYAARRERRCSCAALSSQTPLPPQPPPTPCQTMCSAYGRGIKHTTQCRVFWADSPRRQDDGDTDQIALGGRSAVWHVLITCRRRRDTQVFLPPLLACAYDACVRKSGCWRLESAIPGADVRAAAGVLQALPRRDAEWPGAAWQRPTTVSSVACSHAPLRSTVL